MRRKLEIVVLALAATLMLATQAVAQNKTMDKAKTSMKMDQAPGISKAVAVLNPASGSNVRGVVTFTKDGNMVKVVADIEGLTPGNHGFHIHEFGDCSAKDGSSAGGHFNPAGAPHGAPADKQRHTGDLGNLAAGQDGKVHVEFSDPMLKLDGAGAIIGRGVIVHANPDDLKTQPTGNAGGRQACAVIGVAKP